MGERKLDNQRQFIPSGGVFQLMAKWCENHRVAYNLITQEIEIDKKEVIGWQDVLIDMQPLKEEAKEVINKEKVKTFLGSRYMPKHNPVEDYMYRLPRFEGNPIQNVIDTLKVEQTPKYMRAMLGKWLVGMVATVFEGNPNVLMPVLIGQKAIGKTYWFRNLLPKGLKRYYAEDRLNRGKDSEAILTSKLVVMNDELDGWTKQSAETFRNLISSDYYTYRPPWGERNLTLKRLASICGTSNRSDIIYDYEHNRRIVPIMVEFIDWKAFNAIDKDQLLSQCYQLFLDGFDHELNREEIKLLEEMSTGNRVRSIEMDLIEHFFEPAQPVDKAASWDVFRATAGQIVEYMQSHSNFRNLSRVQTGKALHSLGYLEYAVKGKNGNNIYQLFKREELKDSSHLIDTP